MTRKHYRAIANIIKLERSTEFAINDINMDATLDVLKNVANNLAGYFEQDNPKFNRQRFLDACGIEVDNGKTN